MIRYERRGKDLVATSEVHVGVERVTLSVNLGAWPGALPDAGGLRGTPVVLVSDRDLVDVAVAGIRRSGRLDPVVVGASTAGIVTILRAGAEAAVMASGGARFLDDVRGLAGRPIPALPLDDPDAVHTFLGGCRVDVDLALPSGDEAVRSGALAALAAAGVSLLHQVVEVDPRPAFDELGTDGAQAGLSALAAAAAGVLADRVVATNRRWRAQD